MRNRFQAAHVEYLSVRGVVCARAQERVRGVVDEDEVAQLRTVAVDLDLAVFDAPAG